MIKKILVIEDCADTRNLFTECLKNEGFYAIGAENGLTGIKLAQELLPDLVVCDIMMPQLNGYGVLSQLRTDPAIATIPFIFVTAKKNRTDIRQGMELGADDYLTKPCTVDELLQAIATQFKKKVALQLHYSTQPQPTPELPATDTALSTAPRLIFPSVPQLSEVFHFIEANYHQPISLCDVAEVVGYSPTYLTRLVQQQTGQSLHRWVIERRMAEARSLLLETDQAVKQIAGIVGYRDACHFSRQFRQRHGASPQAWKSANCYVAQDKQDRKN